MNEEQIGRGERVFNATNDAIETSRETVDVNTRINALMALTEEAMQRDDNSPLSRYLSSTVADITLARFRAGDVATLETMVDTVTQKLANPDAQIADYKKMINALHTPDRKTTSSSTAMFYHEQIRNLEAIKEELIQLKRTENIA